MQLVEGEANGGVRAYVESKGLVQISGAPDILSFAALCYLLAAQCSTTCELSHAAGPGLVYM